MNHTRYRKRTEKDDVRSMKNETADFEKIENQTIVLPEPSKSPIIYWCRPDIPNIRPKNIKTEKSDEVFLECSKWPLSTEILCYNCCHKFEGVPIPIPEKFDKKRNIYICYGIFCSWQCSKSFSMYEMSDSRQGTRNMNISLLAQQMWLRYNKDNNVKTEGNYYTVPVTPADKRTSLKIFGGTKTIEEFRKGFFGIIPPEKAKSGNPFVKVNDRLYLPFVDVNIYNRKISGSIVPLNNTPLALHGNNMNMTQKITTSKVHQNANDFCEILNKAKKERLIIKRNRENENANTLLSSMGVTVKKKR